MLLFKPEHIAPILDGRKTQTRRLWPHGKRVNISSEQQARTKMLDAASCFAILGIDRVWQEQLVKISEDDAQAEGYPGAIEYLHAFAKINHIKDFAPDGSDPLLEITVWAVKFHLVRKWSMSEYRKGSAA